MNCFQCETAKQKLNFGQFLRGLFCFHHTEGTGWAYCHKCKNEIWIRYR